MDYKKKNPEFRTGPSLRQRAKDAKSYVELDRITREMALAEYADEATVRRLHKAVLRRIEELDDLKHNKN